MFCDTGFVSICLAHPKDNPTLFPFYDKHGILKIYSNPETHWITLFYINNIPISSRNVIKIKPFRLAPRFFHELQKQTESEMGELILIRLIKSKMFTELFLNPFCCEDTPRGALSYSHIQTDKF